MTDPPAEERSLATYAGFAGMCVIWGSTFLAIRIGNESLPPLWAASLRLAMATPLYLGIARLVGAPWPRGRALANAIGYGLLNYGVSFGLVYWGELYVSSGTTAVLFATTPLTTAVAASVAGIQMLERRAVAGALIGLAGVVSIFAGELTSGGPPGALTAIFAAATASALSGVWLKRGPAQSTWTLNAVGAAVGLAVCLPASFVLGEGHGLPNTPAAWAPLLYLVLAGNLGAYALFGWLVTKWKVTSVSAVTLIIPLIAVALGALVRGETPPAGTYAGALLVLAGVAITLFARRAER